MIVFIKIKFNDIMNNNILFNPLNVNLIIIVIIIILKWRISLSLVVC